MDSGASSTPYGAKRGGRLIDSDDSDEETGNESPSVQKLVSDSDSDSDVVQNSDRDFVVPESDHEDSVGSSSIDNVMSDASTPEISLKKMPDSTKKGRLSLLKGYRESVGGNATNDSVYLSGLEDLNQSDESVNQGGASDVSDVIQHSVRKRQKAISSESDSDNEAAAIELKHKIDQDTASLDESVHIESGNPSDSHVEDSIDTVNSPAGEGSIGSDHSLGSRAEGSIGSVNTAESSHAEGSIKSINSPDSSHVEDGIESVNSPTGSHAEDDIESVNSPAGSYAEDSIRPVHSPSDSHLVDGDVEDLNQTRVIGDNSINMNRSWSDQNNADLIEKDETSLVDLTQSDTSLQNSPMGAQRQYSPQKRDVADIMTELSGVEHDLRVKEALLESINVQTLPDNGRNLMMVVGKLKNQKASLKKELEESQEYFAQKTGLNQFLKSAKATVQSKLNFQPAKMEPRERDVSASEFLFGEAVEDDDDYDDENYSPPADSNISKMPNWGELPNPDMTISGLGKRGMQTYLNEKSLTVEALSKLHSALKSCPSEDTFAEDPKLLKVELMPHQKHGLAWMLWRENEKPSGGILADDMGLGKTLSMISLILKDIENKENSDDSDSDSDDDSPRWVSAKHSRMPRGGTLVVCPASLIAQWEREILKRVKKRALSVELYHGAKRETKPRRLAKSDVVITTYNLVSRESGVETAKNCTRAKDKGPLFMIKWDRIILDEAHMVRNHKSQMALGVCELEGKRRWCLTGTPIQNKELDLYALLKFLRCSPFDDLAVWKKWVDNKNAAGMQRLSTMMKSLMLRRTKEQLQERGDLNCLPAKTFELVDVHLDPEELVIYEKVAIFSSTLFAQFLHQRAEKQQFLDARYGTTTKPVWEQEETGQNQFTTTEELANMHRKMKGLTNIKTHQILVLLLRLRQICCHPGLIKKMVESGDLDFTGGGVDDSDGLDVDLFDQMNRLNIDESDYEREEVEKQKDEQDEPITVDHPVLSFERPSAKIRAVLDLIQEKFLDTEDKAIIVSQWTSMLNIIAKFLVDMKVKFAMLTGEIPVDKRQEIVNSFNQSGSGPQVLLLSLTAGGVGLNLVGANYLLLVDIHWNPQLENQACDRIYRVGQKKDVFIYRFVTVNTIEERIKKLQDFKLTLAENVLTGTRNTQASKLTLDDLKMLFSVPNPELHSDTKNTVNPS